MIFLIPIFEAFIFLSSGLFAIGTAVTGMYPNDQLQMAAGAVGLGHEAGLMDVIVAVAGG